MINSGLISKLPEIATTDNRVMYGAVNYIGVSPCLYCPGRKKDKGVCSALCKARELFASGREYSNKDIFRLNQDNHPEEEHVEIKASSRAKRITAAAKMYETGMSCTDIGVILGVTRFTVIAYLKDAGAETPKDKRIASSAAKRELCRRLYAKLGSIAKVSRKTGIKYPTAWVYISR